MASETNTDVVRNGKRFAVLPAWGLAIRYRSVPELRPFRKMARNSCAELQTQNRLASGVRNFFPRTVRHPVVAIVACMDARIDTSELSGIDTETDRLVLESPPLYGWAYEVPIRPRSIQNRTRKGMSFIFKGM